MRDLERLHIISEKFSKKRLTFEKPYGIKVKRFEDIVQHVQKNVKIFYLLEEVICPALF